MRRWTFVGPGLLLLATAAQAQSMRAFDYDRPARGERQLKAVVEFAAGRLVIGAGASDRLYQLVMQYDAERFQPLGSYDASSGVVRMGVEGKGSGGIRVDRRSALPQTAGVELSKSVDLTLDVSLGAAEATLNLGGLRLSELDIKSGASRTNITFLEPNAGTCRAASVTSGAGEVTVSKTGNSGCASWRFEGGVGSTTLDLSGAWRADANISLTTALGGVKLLVPKDLGIRVTMSGFLAGFDASGFVKSGKTYTSTNFAAAKRKVEMEVKSALGGVSVEWR